MPAAILEVAKRYGLHAEPFEGMSLANLRWLVEQGELVIVPLQAHGEPEQYAADESGHYVVVCGYDEQSMVVQDPATGRIAIANETFERQWHDRDAVGERYVHYGIACRRETPAADLQAAEEPEPAESGDVALPGNDGERAEQLLANSQQYGAKVLSVVAKLAVKRLVEGGPTAWVGAKSLFSDAERQRLVEAMAATSATADLLGRARIRERQRQALKRHDAKRYAELPAAVAIFDEPKADIKPQPPAKALDYFKRLQPTLGVDPQRFGPRMERHAFTLAAATEQTLLDRVKRLISDGLESGKVGTKPQQLADLLDEAGVTSSNPQYAEMAFRTNVMDAYNAGATEELQDPDVADTFPVWQYLGIDDERAGEDHRPHFGKYYQSSVSFVEIRDSIKVRPFNCRCGTKPIDKWTWARLRQNGARIAEGYADEESTQPRIQVKPPAAINQVIAEGGRQVFRGVTNKTHADDMRQGKSFVGAGDYGSGIYVTTDRTMAQQYAAGPQGDSPGDVVRGAIDRRAKIQPIELVDHLHLEAVKRGEITPTFDLGKFARRLGIDAILVRDKGYLNIVNPSILHVDSQFTDEP